MTEVAATTETAGAPWADTAELAETAELEHAEPPAELERQGDDDAEPPAGDTFTREYVTELRRESRDHRHRAQAAETRADELAGQLWAERVAALGLLADPSDLPYDADALDSPDAIRAAAGALLERKPHLRTRRISTRAGQGEGNGSADAVSLSGIMRAHA